MVDPDRNKIVDWLRSYIESGDVDNDAVEVIGDAIADIKYLDHQLNVTLRAASRLAGQSETLKRQNERLHDLLLADAKTVLAEIG